MSEIAIQEHPADAAVASQHPHHDRGLLAIGLFKLAKSGLFFCIGVGALKLLHKDLGDVAMRVAQALHQDPEGRFVTFLMEQADRIDAHRLREIGFATFAYSGLALTEGIGLMLEKVWAEYLTLSALGALRTGSRPQPDATLASACKPRGPRLPDLAPAPRQAVPHVG